MNPITYTRHSDYFLPDIILKDSLLDNPEPLTKYGIMRRTYLKNHRPILYSRMILTEELYPHCREVQCTAENRIDTMMEHLIKRNPPPEKAVDNLAWAVHMNMLKNIAEETILTELIYE